MCSRVEEKVQVVTNGDGALSVSAFIPVSRKDGANGYPSGLQKRVGV